MDKRMMMAHLSQADEHVALGERRIARQREIIAELERTGRDTWSARQLLTQFEEMQALHVDQRDRLLKELDDLSS